MYSDDYDDEKLEKENDNFIKNFYYNNKILIWIFIGIIVFIILMSLLTKGGKTEEPINDNFNILIYPETNVVVSIGNSTRLVASVPNNPGASILWSSANTSVATVDNGTVTGVNYGTTTITATYIYGNNQTKMAQKNIVVADGNPDLKLTDVSFKSGELLMPVNGKYQISLVLTPSNGYITNKSFTSSNSNIVTVDEEGLVQAKKEGEATISLNVNNGAFKKELKVYVNNSYQTSEIISSPTSIKFNSQLRKIKVGQSEVIGYTVSPSDADKSKLIWTSSNEAVVKVDSSGVIKGLKEGRSIITVSSVTGIKQTMDVEVESNITPVSNISLSSESIQLNVGQKTVVTPVISPSNADNKSLDFVTYDTSIIDIEPNNVGTKVTITALRAGRATVTIKSSNNISKKLTIVVVDNGGSNTPTPTPTPSPTPIPTPSDTPSEDPKVEQGFKISSQDANGGRYIYPNYEDTKPANKGATGPVVITLEITDPTVAKLRVAKCIYPASTICSTDVSSAYVINGKGSFSISTTGTYVIMVSEYDKDGNLIGTFDKYIWIKAIK